MSLTSLARCADISPPGWWGCVCGQPLPLIVAMAAQIPVKSDWRLRMCVLRAALFRAYPHAFEFPIRSVSQGRATDAAESDHRRRCCNDRCVLRWSAYHQHAKLVASGERVCICVLPMALIVRPAALAFRHTRGEYPPVAKEKKPHNNRWGCQRLYLRSKKRPYSQHIN